MIRALVLAIALAAVAAPTASTVWADYDFSWRPSKVDQEFEDRMANARAKIVEISRHRRGREQRELAREAYDRVRSALERKPNDPEANYIAGELIFHWDLFDWGTRKWLDRAIGHYTRYLASNPRDTRTRAVLFTRSILYSKRAVTKRDFEPDFQAAIADYDRQIAMLDTDTNDAVQRTNLATTLSNAAELHMGVGELDRAIELYVQSIAIEPDSLYQFGLAVALDRDGQRLRAAEVMLAAIHSDSPRPQDNKCALFRNSVFFVPTGDKSYYLALRAEVLGKYAEARRHYQVFLRRLGDNRYADVARANLAALRGKRDNWKPSTKECH